jgi:serine/threonine protein phosphatase PrpC
MLEWVFRKDIGGRKEQQDSGCVLYKDECLFALVADGLGGHNGGIASKAVVEKTKEIFERQCPPEGAIIGWMSKIFFSLEQAVQKSAMLNRCDTMTTVVFLVVTKRQAYWFHLGDSRLYFFREDEIVRTKDHSQVQKLLDLGMIKEEQMAQHYQQNLLLGCLGGGAEKTPDYQSRDFVQGDAILLCSDGFWEYFSKQEMQLLVRKKNIKTAADRALTLVRRRGGVRGDNISFIIVKKIG